MKTMINRLSVFLTQVAERWVPDPMTIAILLSFITLLIALCDRELSGGSRKVVVEGSAENTKLSAA